MLQSLFLKIPIGKYCVINMCALFSPKKILTISPKQMFILRKHDFSRKLTGGTGLQGVSSNLNIFYDGWHFNVCHFYSRVLTFCDDIK